ncbi:putative C6 transcription factor [Talaromyces proteolyticus]|uniref:C6 transcription factor n=1 Tax=Talaromyces proteolyticus TaxID=1131652 RepID=A0AAD4Q485_9EURO|nr:putative C6 transcription factor [Talaromyces proteolyticus]KAH8705909.1 putative C6 transcription factor [Talaromyces proteolyticus]
MSAPETRRPRGSVNREPSPGEPRTPAAVSVRLEHGEPATKRRKTRLACDECRNKKIKCDGVRPLCGACTKKGWSEQKCVYNNADRRDWAGMRQLVGQLQGRIRSLEHEIAEPMPGSESQVLVSRPPQQQHPVLTGSDYSRLLYDVGIAFFNCSDETLPMQTSVAPNRQDPTQLLYHPKESQISASQDVSLTSSRIADCPDNSTVPERDDSISIHDRSRGVSAIVGAVTGEEQNHSFHGTSSAVTFMQEIRQAINARVGVSPASGHDGYQNNQTFNYVSHQQRSSAGFVRKRLASDYVLPPRKLADELFQTYWVYVYPLYPFLDKKSFMQSYNSIWTGDWPSTSTSSSSTPVLGVDEPTAICTFNMVLALACQYSHAVEEESRRDTAKTFFFRAKDCLQFDPVDSSNHSIHLVQALLLFGQYLQSIGSPHEAWGAIGVATRICHELGFHLKNESTIQTVRERETVRRVYHGCVMMDRMLSMNLGRPPMVSVSMADSLPLPLDFDEDWEDGRDNRTAETSERASKGPSTLSFFTHSAKLYSIMHKILLSIYPDEKVELLDDSERYFIGLEPTFQIDHDLTKWCRSIPDHLKINPALDSQPIEEQRSTFCRLSFILWARFLHVRLYLLRPIFARFCIYSQIAHNHNNHIAGTTDHYAVSQIPSYDMISYRMALQCSILCVKTARELIAVICKQFTAERSWGRKPSWLLSVLHVYLAAAVLIAIRLRPDIPWEVTEPEIEASWTSALEILRDYRSDSRSAQRCVAALEILHEKLSSNSQLGQAQQEQRHWQGDLAEFETQFRLDQGYQTLDGATGAWNWDYKQTWLEDFIFLDPLNI